MKCFVFLDSWRNVPQKVQHLVIRNYADSNGLEIEFYGDELYGYEHDHLILKDYVMHNTFQAFLFFSIHQFRRGTNDQSINIDMLVEYSYKFKSSFYFALEDITINSTCDLECIETKLFVYNCTVSQKHQHLEV